MTKTEPTVPGAYVSPLVVLVLTYFPASMCRTNTVGSVVLNSAVSGLQLQCGTAGQLSVYCRALQNKKKTVKS